MADIKSRVMALGALGALLTACTSGPGNLRVHEVSLYGAGAQQLAWVYGDLNGAGSSSVKIGGQTVTLRPQVQGSLAVPGSLSVNGKATYSAPQVNTLVAPSINLSRDTTTGTFSLSGSERPSAVYYTDGRSWQRLSATTGTASGVPVSGLRGAGALTDAEADALSRELGGQGVLAVAVIEGQGPGPSLSVEPAPKERRRTALYLIGSAQITSVTTTTTTTATTTTTTNSPSAGGSTTGGTMTTPSSAPFLGEVANGTNAAVTSFSVQVARTASEARALYGLAYGRQTTVPTPPSLGRDEALVGVFLGSRPTGGYRVRVLGATVQGGTLSLRAEVSAPGAGSITTQAITSPWAVVRVRGAFSEVKVTDASGQPLKLGTGGNDR